jgi:hypothetical protein
MNIAKIQLKRRIKTIPQIKTLPYCFAQQEARANGADAEVHMSTLMIIIGGILLLVSNCWACSFDTDCEPGSKCLKGSSSIYGICAGGISPGNTNDSKPVYAPLDTNNTYGNTCEFNTDCGPGSKCLKSSGSINGVCIHPRSGEVYGD